MSEKSYSWRGLAALLPAVIFAAVAGVLCRGAEVSPPIDKENATERQGNPMKGHTFIFNQDCNDVTYSAPPGQAQAWIRDWFQRAFAAGADVLVADVALPDVVETKDTPTGEQIGARFGQPAADKTVSAGGVPVNAGYWYRTNQELFAQNTDVLHLACEEGRKAGAVVLAGMRMSDAHHGADWQPTSDSPLFAQFVMDHPEWCNTWPDGRRDATLNYAIPEVQAHRLQILRELATNYAVDGLELNWMRWCRHFPAGKQREHLQDLTNFVQQVRAMLDQVAAAKGRGKMILGHRLPVSVEECLNIGCDVATWAKLGYADFLAPMDFLLNDPNVRTEEFVKAAEGTPCLVYPGFGSTKYSFGYVEVGYDDRTDGDKVVMMRSLDQYRATAANWFAWGAAGGSSFNMYLWPQEQQEFYTQAIGILSAAQKALAGRRYYLYLPTWKDGGNPTGVPNRQRLTFGPDTLGKRQVFTFRMADGKNGSRLQGTLRFRIYGATAADEFTVDLNGTAIAREKLSITPQPQGEAFEKPEEPLRLPGGSFVWPANLCFAVALADCPPFRGDNELGITLVKRDPAAGKAPAMEALEVRVQ
jgi:hypothetical protein